jgi:hypothetical protein
MMSDMVRVSGQLSGVSRIFAMGTTLSNLMTTTNGTITHPDHRGA